MLRKRAEACFMSRLRRDTRGNVLAISAAALLPLAGLIGGGVDMSRLYLTKTRLQQACDAGALAGRKAMAAGSWTTGEGDTSEARAAEFFRANFQEGAYGSDDLNFTFIEDEGEVRGWAIVTVPMTMMRIFNMQERDMEVTCTAKMEIPNTDVMFVLDVTYSMSGSKMTGLKGAVKCFYEALLRVNTPEPCSTAPAADPTATAYNGSAQIRLGFVPYGVNVNVGRLLHNDWMADSWTYQSRLANVVTVYSWETGTETTPDWGDWSGPPANSNLRTTSGYNSSWSDVGATTLADGIPYPSVNPAGTNSTNCANLNGYGGSGSTRILGLLETTGNPGTVTYTPTNNNPPVHPANMQNLTASQSRPATVSYGYRYEWRSNKCQLRRASARTGSNANRYTQYRTGPATRPIEWTEHQHVEDFTYGPRSIDISGLKTGNSNWAAGVAISNMGFTNGDNVRLSGSNTNTRIRVPTSNTTTWDGCIEERKTFKTSNTDPSGDWTPIPASALDMNIDLVPDAGTTDSHWGPLLEGATWGRYSGSTSNRSFTPLNTSADLNRNFETRSCHTSNVARKLREYKTAGDVSNFVSYINNLVAYDYGTYHDPGMLWGARLLSPTGIFADENRETAGGGNIQRHLIFMTDGNAQAYAPNNSDVSSNYGPYGIAFYDRRQTTYAPKLSHLEALTNARLLALCAEIKRRNIRLWVISYGGDVDAANEARLRQCASSGNFYSAADGPALRARFQQIAAEIADLRLTN